MARRLRAAHLAQRVFRRRLEEAGRLLRGRRGRAEEVVDGWLEWDRVEAGVEAWRRRWAAEGPEEEVLAEGREWVEVVAAAERERR